jgi:hypothetical protein
MKKFWFVLMLVLPFSCEQEGTDMEALGENAGILGTWVEDSNQEDVTLFNRSDSLDPDRYGFIIRENGVFLERKNAGWCGTPPITYDNYEGSWVALSDSLLEVTVGYWGGTMSYQIRIVFVNHAQLGIRYLYGENTADAR